MRFYLTLLFSIQFFAQASQLTFLRQPADQPDKVSFSAKFDLLPEEFIYYDNLQISCNSPVYQLESWAINEKAEELFDPAYQKTKKILNKSFTISGVLAKSADDAKAQVVIQYESNKSAGVQLVLFPLEQAQKLAKNNTENKAVQSGSEVGVVPVMDPALTCPAPHKQPSTIGASVQRLIASSDSWFIRILLVFLLGMLMSFTPCIYPMIPITIGILHGTKRTRLSYQVARALCYMAGVALMFAFLGLVAATTGALFGSFLQKPLVIAAIIVFLLYLAFSMFGWYELYVPRFFNRSSRRAQPTGTCLSAFIFGFVSGTVASPCLSPGLAFLLSVVAALGNKLLGFVLLFAFGVGMSVPLLLIGTFAPLINYMPRAGHWMAEIKKIFGLLLVALSFYFLGMIVPKNLVWWLIATTMAGIGFYFAVRAYLERLSARYVRTRCALIALSSLAVAAVMYWRAIEHDTKTEHKTIVSWSLDYATARAQAQRERKWLLVDVGAPYCAICKAIDRCVFNDTFIAPLINSMVPVYIDASSSTDYSAINERYKIVGVPTILVINPYNQVAQQRWGSELYSYKKADIIHMVQQLIAQEPKVR